MEFNFEPHYHELIDVCGVKLNDVWEVGGHVYTVVGISYVDNTVEFLVNNLTYIQKTMDDSLKLYQQMLDEDEEGREWLEKVRELGLPTYKLVNQDLCPYCQCRTDDVYGGPCSQCWDEVYEEENNGK